MNGLRDTLLSYDSYREFSVNCSACDEILFEVDEYINGRDALVEAVIFHRIEEHARSTGHRNIDVIVEPTDVLNAVSVAITVNQNA